MAGAADTFGIFYENLLDAGCDDKTVELCMDYARKGEWSVLLSLLAPHRKVLLEQLHVSQKKIDCLDFLIYRLKKEYLGGN